jgi:hypothetical protein
MDLKGLKKINSSWDNQINAKKATVTKTRFMPASSTVPGTQKYLMNESVLRNECWCCASSLQVGELVHVILEARLFQY